MPASYLRVLFQTLPVSCTDMDCDHFSASSDHGEISNDYVDDSSDVIIPVSWNQTSVRFGHGAHVCVWESVRAVLSCYTRSEKGWELNETLNPKPKTETRA